MKGNGIAGKWGALLGVAAIFFLAWGTAFAQEKAKAQLLVDDATITVNDFIADPDMQWLRDHARDAKAILITPSLLKAGFIFGGSGGRAVLLAKGEGDTWSNPVFYTMGSVSFGLQIGGEAAQVLMLIMSERGLEALYSSSAKIGADVSVAAGPVGTTAGGSTALNLSADYLTFARAKGAYAGLNLDGAVIKVNHDWNKAYYGRDVRPTDIVIKREVRNPDCAKLKAAVAKLTK